MSVFTPKTPITWANYRWAYGQLFYATRADYWAGSVLVPGTRVWRELAELRRNIPTV